MQEDGVLKINNEYCNYLNDVDDIVDYLQRKSKGSGKIIRIKKSLAVLLKTKSV